MKKTLVAVMVAATSLVSMSPSTTRAESCENTSLLPTSVRPTLIEFVGSEIGHGPMSVLWDIVSVHETSHPLLGKTIGADQDWFGQCKYPGLGISAGSGFNLDTRNVGIWVWADGVDIERARQSILVLIGATTSASTSTTTTTTTSIVGTASQLSPSTQPVATPAVDPTPIQHDIWSVPIRLEPSPKTFAVPKKKSCRSVTTRRFSTRTKTVLTVSKRICR